MAREVGGWDEVARRRAEAARRTSPEARALQLELLRLAGEVGGLRVVVLACGRGALARRLAERGARVLALDPSADAIERALEEVRELEPQGRLEFAVADPDERASLPSGPFDLVVWVEGSLRAGLENAVRPLRRGGRLLLAVPHPAASREPRPLQALFGRIRRAGLRVIDVAECDAHLALLTERPRRRRPRHR